MTYSVLNKATIVALLAITTASGCSSLAHHSTVRKMPRSNTDPRCILQFTPAFTNTLYSAYIDVTKHHFSGLLFFKRMPDSSTRIVFTNEVGVKFFDFEFASDGRFTKHYALNKLDKKIVINALENDMRLILLKPNFSAASTYADSTFTDVCIPQKKGYYHYLTKNCNELVNCSRASKRKTIVTTQMLDYRNGVPDSIHVHHHNFKFNIALKRVEK